MNPRVFGPYRGARPDAHTLINLSLAVVPNTVDGKDTYVVKYSAHYGVECSVEVPLSREAIAAKADNAPEFIFKEVEHSMRANTAVDDALWNAMKRMIELALKFELKRGA